MNNTYTVNGPALHQCPRVLREKLDGSGWWKPPVGQPGAWRMWRSVVVVATLGVALGTSVVMADDQRSQNGPEMPPLPADFDGSDEAMQDYYEQLRAAGFRVDEGAQRAPAARSAGDAAGPVTVAGGWQVEADPLPDELRYPAAARVATPLPGTPRLLMASTPSPFIALVENNLDGHERIIFDLRSNRRVGRVRGRLVPQGHMASRGSAGLSPDGQWIAESGRGTQGWRAFVASTRGHAPAIELTLPNAQQYTRIDFAPDNRVIAFGSTLGSPARVSLEAIDLARREPAWSVQATARGWPDLAAFSPGRRFLAVPASDGSELQVHLFRTDTGARAGTLVIGEALSEHDVSRLRGVAFSTDGRRLAVLADRGHLLIYDATSGALERHVPIDSSLAARHIHAGALQWLDDEQYVLLGGVQVVHLSTGEVVHTLPEPGPTAMPQMRTVAVADGAGEDGALGVLSFRDVPDRGNRSGGRQISVEPLPMQQIAARLAALEAGGTIEEAGLAPAREPVFDGMVEFEAVEPGPARLADLDPAPAEASRLLPRPVSLTLPRLLFQHILTAPTGRFALVHDADGPKQPEGRRPPIHLVDLTGQTPVQAIQMPGIQAPLAISPDGTHALFHMGEHRLDVFRLQPLEHVVGWHLSEDSPQGGSIREVVFLDNEHLLMHTHEATGSLLSRRRTLTLWKLPEVQALYSMDMRYAQANLRHVSPGGRYMVRGRREAIDLIDRRTGAVAATLETLPGNCIAATFTRDGGRLAALMLQGSTQSILVWDLSTGELLHRHTVSADVRGPLHWIDDRYLMLGGYLFDLEAGVAAWHYEGASRIPTTATGTIWGVTRDEGTLSLGSVRLPHEAARRAMAGGATGDSVKPLVGPGHTASLDLRGVPDEAAVRARLTQRFADAGITVRDDGELTFRVHYTRTGSERRTYQVSRGGQTSEVSVTIRTMQTAQAWLDADGQTLWEHTVSEAHDPGDMILLRDGQTIEQYIEQRYARNLGMGGPVLLMPSLDQTILGQSKINAVGVSDE